MKAIIEKFAKLFIGYEFAHGQHELNGKPDEHGKIKGRASTKGTGASVKEYTGHLMGEGTSLGLIPLMEDDTCWFGAIDIDIQGERPLKEPIEQLEKRIRKLELPLVVCRSKSGGAHLYCFGKEPIAAKLLVGKLAEYAALIGYGGCEVFPKQTSRVNAEDRGNWINIAYYGALGKKGTDRYAIKNGKPIRDIEDFLKYADLMRISKDALKTVDVKLSALFSDGPPCLQHLATFGFEAGGRNNSLMNVAVYYKKARPDDWQDQVAKFNFEHMKPALDIAEVNQVIKNVQRKEYFYTCKIPPICNHCDKKLCSKREFGIDAIKSADVPRIENLTKCISRDSVRWYGEYQGNRFQMQTEHFSSGGLRKLFLEQFNILGSWKQRDVDDMFNEALLAVQIQIDPEDASRQGQFENMVDNFFTASRPARNKDELIKGNSFIEDGRILFRSEDLFNYLTIHRFQHTPHEIWTWLNEMKAAAKQVRVKGKMLRVWTLPEPERFDTSKGIDLPNELEEEL